MVPNQPSQLLPLDPEQGQRVAQSIHRRADGDLLLRNVTTAIGLGILVGDAAIRQILTGGPGPLGERRG